VSFDVAQFGAGQFDVLSLREPSFADCNNIFNGPQ
jgi:hypothetical protein